MNFYVYESYASKRVRVHIGHCSYCNEGKGTKLIGHLDSRWHGPFDTLLGAKVLAKSLKRKNTRTCLICLDGGKF